MASVGTHPILADLAIVLCVAAVTTVVFRHLRQPVVLGYLLAGVLVGPYTPIPLFAGAETLKTLSELGVILVMFSIGLEFSLRRLAQVFPRAGLVGLVEIGLMMWLGYLTAQALGWGRQESVFAGAIPNTRNFFERRSYARIQLQSLLCIVARTGLQVKQETLVVD
jgi:CPA2 family monovalent cation:H+ antiporter-2